jgi:hypothetical protein
MISSADTTPGTYPFKVITVNNAEATMNNCNDAGQPAASH